MEPHSLEKATGGGGWVGMGLACGLKDQRLMARPPARAGGRSGLLTGGESGKPNGSSLSSPKGYPPTSPARPAGGRAVTGLSLGGPQARPLPDQPPFLIPLTREWGSKGKEPPSPWCSFPYFFQEIGPRPGGLRSRPFQRRREKPTRAPRPGRPAVPTAPGPPTPSPRCPYSPKTAIDSPAYPAGPPGAGRHRPPPPPGRCPPSSGRARRGSPPGRRPAGQRRPG